MLQDLVMFGEKCLEALNSRPLDSEVLNFPFRQVLKDLELKMSVVKHSDTKFVAWFQEQGGMMGSA